MNKYNQERQDEADLRIFEGLCAVQTELDKDFVITPDLKRKICKGGRKYTIWRIEQGLMRMATKSKDIVHVSGGPLTFSDMIVFRLPSAKT